MGTRSLTYVYDSKGNIIVKMYLQFDGYLSGHGYDLAIFLKSYCDDNHNYDMERLASDLVSKFLPTQQGYAMLVSPFDKTYYCEEWVYHIYSDKVVILGDSEYEADWKTNEFI